MAKSRRIAPSGFDGAGVRFINPAQVGGIETGVLDDGAGRGVRVAWVNTGSPLRYRVLIDRGLDIDQAFYSSLSLAYLSLTGPTAPSRALDRGMEWLRGFYGGLCCSCGPQHVGAPEIVDGQAYGLHGTHSNTPAQVEIICQPDPAAGVDSICITGVVRTARMFGPNVELRRTIRSQLGRSFIHIHDEFLNRGNTPAPHAWLLHLNFGWPLLSAGTRLVYKGGLQPRPDLASLKWFANPRRYRVVGPPAREHAGAGEACCFIDPPADRDGLCHAGLVNERLGLGVEVRFPKAHFPRLVNWQHLGPCGEYVVGLEPISGGMHCGVDPISLDPGGTRGYDCTLEVLTDPAELKRFVRTWGLK